MPVTYLLYLNVDVMCYLILNTFLFNTQSRSAGQEKELNRQYQEKEKQLHETQLSFAKRLGQAEQEINMLRTGGC